MTIGSSSIAAGLRSLSEETNRSFEWLASGIDRREPITFIPNPGNIGDAAINIACYRFLSRRFDKVEVCGQSDAPSTDCIFIGGGGNLVEPLYRGVAGILGRLPTTGRIFLFPSTVVGNTDVLERIGSRTRIVCREEVSFRWVSRYLPAASVDLAHDAAFTLVDWLRESLSGRIAQHNTLEARLYRTDHERAMIADGDFDIMAQGSSGWTDLAAAERLVMVAARYISGFGRVHTDRLHCAILAAMLERDTILKPNSYFKNEAVFRHSLSRLPNVHFDTIETLRQRTESDPPAFAR